MRLKKTTRLAVVLIALLVSACSSKDSTDNTRPEDYKCTSDQLNLVKKEYEICKETGYFSSYCFAQAKKTQCELIKRTKPVSQED